MRFTKHFLRQNSLGASLTLIGSLCLAGSAMLYLGHSAGSRFAMADGPGLGGPGLEGADVDLLDKQNKAYERIAQTVTPSVVYIRTEQLVKVQQSPLLMDPFFRQFFGDVAPQLPREERQHALGSGVIVDPAGYVITNNHVIQHASNIEVTLKDKRTFKGKLVGTIRTRTWPW